MDYENGKIYCILNHINSEVYVGSTCSLLSKRMHGHKVKARYSMEAYGSTAPIHKAMHELGHEHFYIELIESYPCKSKDELKAKEGQYIRERGSYNMTIAGRGWREYQQDNKAHLVEYHKSWYDANRERILEKDGDKIQCQCGKTFTFGHKARHARCKRHQRYLENKTEQVDI
jgi:hypothetical protein